MTNYNLIRDSLDEAVQVYRPDMNIYRYVPRTLVPPAAIVKPRAGRTIDYLQMQSSGMARWNFTIMLIVGLVDEEAAQIMVGDMISPGSPLIFALQNATLPNGYVTVTDGAVNEMMVDQSLYTYAELSVVVTS